MGGQRCSTSLVHSTSNTGAAEKRGPAAASTVLGLSLAHAAGRLCSCAVARGWHKGRYPQQEPDQCAVWKSHVRASLLEKRRSRGSPPKLPLSISAPRTLPRRKLKPHQCRQPKLPLEEILSSMWQSGQSGWESSDSSSPLPPGNSKGCPCCAAGTTHTRPGVRGKALGLCTVTSAAQSPVPQLCQRC